MTAARPSVDPRLAMPPKASLDWAIRSVGGVDLLAIEPLGGGVSHANHRLRIGRDEKRIEVVLRRCVRTGWLDEDPEYSPAQEIATYGLLASSAVPAPRLLDADPTPEHCDVPALLLTLAPGRRIVRPADVRSLAQGLAEALPAVHSVDPGRAADAVPSYRPFYERERLAVPEWSRRPDVWRRAIERFDEPPESSLPAFIHRDFHPGNTLWSEGRLTAIVDWTLASFGPPEFDLAHMRANLALLYSLDVADGFLACYRNAVGRNVAYDPRWDIRGVLDWVPELPRNSQPAAALLRLELLVARALADLGG